MPAYIWDGVNTLLGLGSTPNRVLNPDPPPPPVGLQTLHLIEDDITEIRSRFEIGPFNVIGNGATFGDVTRIVGYKDALVAAPLSTRWAGPTGNNDGGFVQSASDPGNNLNQTSNGSTFRPPDKEGGYIRDAAFFALIKKNLTVATVAKNSLMAQVNYLQTDFSDTSRWNPNNTADKSDEGPWWTIAVWMLKQIYAYDFLVAFEFDNDVELFTSAERLEFKEWVLSFAVLCEKLDSNNLDPMYTNRTTYVVSNEGKGRPAHSKPRYRDDSKVAEAPYTISIRYNNRSARTAIFTGVAGLYFDDAAMQLVGERYVKEGLRFGCYPDGSVSDFERAEVNVAEPTVGWKYSCEFVGMLLLMAHALYTYNGDDSLFTESTSQGFSESAGGPKTLLTATRGLLQHVDNTWVRYKGNGTFGNPEHRIKPGGPSTNTTTVRRYNDLEVGPIMDHYLQGIGSSEGDYIRDRYMRYATGCNPQPNPPRDGQGDVEGGPSGVWPGALLMFGRL